MDEHIKEAPIVALIMGFMGGLSILGGAILCVTGWPGDPGSGYVWKSTAYTPALTWLFSGFVSGMLFFAVAAALTYLHGTCKYTEAIVHKLCGETENSQSGATETVEGAGDSERQL